MTGLGVPEKIISVNLVNVGNLAFRETVGIHDTTALVDFERTFSVNLVNSGELLFVFFKKGHPMSCHGCFVSPEKQ